jgi:hypothetical protein
MMRNIVVLIMGLFSFCFGQNEIVIGVSEFVYKGDITRAEAALVSEAVRSYVESNRKYILIDLKLMNEILKAQKVSSYPQCSNKKCLEDLGKLLSTNAMIGGEIERKNNVIKMHLMVADVQQNKIINSVDSTLKTSRKDFFNFALPGLCATLLKPQGTDILWASSKNADSNKKVSHDKSQNARSFLQTPLTWIGISTLLVGGGAAYLATSHHDQKSSVAGGDIPINDAPARTRP